MPMGKMRRKSGRGGKRDRMKRKMDDDEDGEEEEEPREVGDEVTHSGVGPHGSASAEVREAARYRAESSRCWPLPAA